MGRGAERGESIARGIGIPKNDSGSAVGADDLGFDREILHHRKAQGGPLISHICGGSQQQSSAADEQIHPGELLANGVPAEIEFHGVLLTTRATFNRSELRLRPARWAAARLISNLTRLPSRINSMMPPCLTKSGISDTVRTAAVPMVFTMAGNWLDSELPTKRIRHPAASTG